MIPWEEIGRARADGGGVLVLYRRGGEYVIRVDGRELMSSRAHGSEEALARMACERIAGRPAPRVLVGGLGMGYTLRAALEALPADATVAVAEIVEAVVRWNQGPLAALAGRPLDDPRVRVEVADVGAVLRRTRVRFDAVLLDVDNGPQALTRPGNHVLYSGAGLGAVRRALRPGGVLSVWSADRSPAFALRLVRAGFAADIRPAPARGRPGDPLHFVYVGVAPGG